MDNMRKLKEYYKLIDNFSNATIAVIGDMVVDISIFGKPTRLSREAPVIVVEHEYESISPGGAGNTVNNISKLDVKVYPVCIVGNDAVGDKLGNYFSTDSNVDPTGIFKISGYSTITKTRILAGDTHTTKQQVIRIDKTPKFSMTKKLENKILKHMDAVNKKVNAWVVSDYGYDMVSAAILERIKEYAKGKTVIVDSRNRIMEYKGVTMVAPNESEAGIAAGMEIDENNVLIAGKKLLKEIGTEAVIITRGNQGMILFEKNGNTKRIPISGTKEVSDVTGAGDTVTAILAIAYASGTTPLQAARLSNFGAAVVVMKNGTATLSRSELIKIIEKEIENLDPGISDNY